MEQRAPEPAPIDRYVVLEYLAEEVDPLLDRYRDLAAVRGEVRV